MTGRIVHHQRLAWDCARVFVALTDSDRDYEWLYFQLTDLVGPEYAQALSETRTRVLWQTLDNAVNIEAGLWRARIVDLLASRPETGVPLETLMHDARARAAQPYALR